MEGGLKQALYQLPLDVLVEMALCKRGATDGLRPLKRAGKAAGGEPRPPSLRKGGRLTAAFFTALCLNVRLQSWGEHWPLERKHLSTSQCLSSHIQKASVG